MKLVEKNLNGFGAIGIVAVVAVLVVLAGGGYFAYQRFSQKAALPPIISFDDCVKAGYPVAGGVTPSFCVTPDGRRFVEKADEGDRVCTQEAKLCPDGSYVSRTGPNCEFAACPGEAGTTPAPSEVEGWKTYPSTSSGQAAIDTSDWKVYRNEKYGFEVRYPPQILEAVEQAVDDKPDWHSHRVVAFFEKNRPPRAEFLNQVFIDIHRTGWAVFRKTPFISLDDYIEYDLQFRKVDNPNAVNNLIKVFLGTLEAAKEEESPERGQAGFPMREARYIFFHNSLIYEIYNGNIDKKIYEPIVATFRFIQ